MPTERPPADPLLQPLEALLNRHIAASAQARELLGRLAGRSLELRVRATPLRLRFTADNDRLNLSSDGDTAADALIEGLPLALAALAGPQPEERIRRGDIRISGDAEAAQSFQALLQAARPDLEEEMSRLIGDVAAHHLARVARGAFDFGRKAADTMARNMGEYLSEESRDLPARAELDAFAGQVDTLRDDLDRFEARLALLERGDEGDGA